MTALGSVIDSGTFAARPAFSIDGRLYFATDTHVLYRDTGAAWEVLDVNDAVTTKGDILIGDAADSLIRLGIGANGTILKAASGETSGALWRLDQGFINLTVDGGGSAITTGVKGYVRVPYAGTITKNTVLLDQSGSIVFDIWKDTYANYPPTVADTITAAAKPTVSTATKSEDATLTGWTVAITAGDVIGFNVDSITTATRAHLQLEVTKL